MHTQIRKDCVEFREGTSQGVRVIRVSLSTPTPRVTCLVELHRSDRYSQAPMAIYLDELEKLVNQAKKILKGEASMK